MKILVIRFSSIGDIVLTTPVLRCIKKQLPDAVVHYLTKDKFASVLSANPYIDKLYTYKDEWESLLPLLKEEQYDIVIDLHNNLRSTYVKRALGVKSYTLDKLNLQKWLLVNLKINMMPERHIVDRYMDVVKSTGVKNDYKGLDYFIPAADEVPVYELPFMHMHGYMAVVIGGTYATKRLPIEKLITLCQSISTPIILLGGNEDAAIGNQVAEAVGIRCFNACGKYSINQSASIIKQAIKVVTHDTGMMHIAAAFNKEVVSIWGNTVPAFGMTPYMPQHPERSAIYEVKNLKCRPCSKLGYDHCPKKHFKCMQEQPIDDIATHVNRV